MWQDREGFLSCVWKGSKQQCERKRELGWGRDTWEFWQKERHCESADSGRIGQRWPCWDRGTHSGRRRALRSKRRQDPRELCVSWEGVRVSPCKHEPWRGITGNDDWNWVLGGYGRNTLTEKTSGEIRCLKRSFCIKSLLCVRHSTWWSLVDTQSCRAAVAALCCVFQRHSAISSLHYP